MGSGFENGWGRPLRVGGNCARAAYKILNEILIVAPCMHRLRDQPLPCQPLPCQPSVVPVVRESDRDLWTWMIDSIVHTWYASMEKQIQEAVNVVESYSDGYIVFFSSKPSSSNKVSSFAYGRKTIRSSRVLL